MKILAIMLELQKDVRGLERGCDCEHDYRCGRCSRIIKAQEVLNRLTPAERIADLETINALENILPRSTATTELIEQLRALTNAEVV
jgi:hypothetical protein